MIVIGDIIVISGVIVGVNVEVGEKIIVVGIVIVVGGEPCAVQGKDKSGRKLTLSTRG